MRDLIKMVVVLTAICAGSALVLSYTNKATKVQREYQLLKYVKGPSILAVLSDYDNDPIKDAVVVDIGKDQEGNPVQKTVFPAKKDGKLIAVAYNTMDEKGYGGAIDIMVGMDNSGDLTGISIMTSSESPGYGAEASKPAFTDQFKGMYSKDINLTADGGKIDAVSGATTTSKAVVRALKRAVEIFPAIKKEVS
ncbi:MAG: RnfABCDGE type electron transport complex subunit G [Thermodesulfobacteriota bacterium]|nr:RnfABCDGE type electron transport complex subunit G [Thermodesulfobacteriota bacterium]